MPETSLTVKIGAETVDLETKAAIANAQVKVLGATVRDLANEYSGASTELKGQLLPAVQAATAAWVAQKTELAGLRTEIREVGVAHNDAFGSMREKIEGLSAPIEGMRAAFGALSELFLVGFGVERFVEAIEKIAEMGEKLHVLSETTGVAVDSLQAWQFAAEHAGVPADTLNSALVKLGRSMQEAIRNPASTAGSAFRAMGIDAQFLTQNSNDVEAVLRRVADAFQAHAAGAQAEAVATAIFGRGSAELISVLREGSVALDEAKNRVAELGATMDEVTANQMEKHRQAILDLKTAWLGLELQATPIINALTAGIEGVANALAWASRNMDLLVTAMTSIVAPPGSMMAMILTVLGMNPSGGAGLAGGLGGSTLGNALTGAVEVTITTLPDVGSESLGDQAFWTGQPEFGNLGKGGGARGASVHSGAGSGLAPETPEDSIVALNKEMDAEQAVRDRAAAAIQAAKDKEDATDKARMAALTKDREAEAAKAVQIEQQQDAQIASFLSRSLMGMLTSRQSFAQSAAMIGDRLLEKLLQYGIRELLDSVRINQAKVASAGVAAGATGAIHGAAAAEGAALSATTATTQITTDAGVSAAGAFASTISIPFIGPVAAPAAAAVALSTVLGFLSFIASAEGGYDVPPGLRPLTMLHPKEMVLPADIAQPLREGLGRPTPSLGGAFQGSAPAAGGGSVSVAAPLTIHHHGSSGDLVDMLTRLNRSRARELGRKMREIAHA